VWAYLMKDRTEASKLLKGFIGMVKYQFNKVIKAIKSDNGSEFTSRPMKEFYLEHGILCDSVVWTPRRKMNELIANIITY